MRSSHLPHLAPGDDPGAIYYSISVDSSPPICRIDFVPRYADPRTSKSPRPSSAAEIEELKPVALGRSSDEDLMRRTQGGDRQAFSLLYERYSASVLSYLFRMLGNV